MVPADTTSKLAWQILRAIADRFDMSEEGYLRTLRTRNRWMVKHFEALLATLPEEEIEEMVAVELGEV